MKSNIEKEGNLSFSSENFVTPTNELCFAKYNYLDLCQNIQLATFKTRKLVNKLILMLPPCHFLLYSSSIIVTLTEETNRSNHSDTKKLDHFITCNIISDICFDL